MQAKVTIITTRKNYELYEFHKAPDVLKYITNNRLVRARHLGSMGSDKITKEVVYNTNITG